MDCLAGFVLYCISTCVTGMAFSSLEGAICCQLQKLYIKRRGDMSTFTSLYKIQNNFRCIKVSWCSPKFGWIESSITLTSFVYIFHHIFPSTFRQNTRATKGCHWETEISYGHSPWPLTKAIGTTKVPDRSCNTNKIDKNEVLVALKFIFACVPHFGEKKCNG